MNYDRGISYQVMEESVVCHDRPIPCHACQWHAIESSVLDDDQLSWAFVTLPNYILATP